MRITLTGAGGFVGRRLVESLIANWHTLHVVGRKRPGWLPGEVSFGVWDALSGAPPAESLCQSQAVIHLAGEPVAQRWTSGARRRIRESRVEGTRRLVEGIASAAEPPPVLICASAVGYYGSRGEELLTEETAPGEGFLSEVCRGWEEAARSAEALGLRVVMLRIGLVLGTGGGALARMLPLFQKGAGGRLGAGQQWMSWIHIDDLVSLIQFVLDRYAVRGAVNAVSPNPVRNVEFTEALARALRRRARLPAPAFALRLALGEMAEMLLGSQRVVPKAALEAGFGFQHPDLEEALRDLLSKRLA